MCYASRKNEMYDAITIQIHIFTYTRCIAHLRYKYIYSYTRDLQRIYATIYTVHTRKRDVQRIYDIVTRWIAHLRYKYVYSHTRDIQRIYDTIYIVHTRYLYFTYDTRMVVNIGVDKFYLRRCILSYLDISYVVIIIVSFIGLFCKRDL